VRYSILRRFQGGRSRFVKIDLDMIEASKDERTGHQSHGGVTTNYSFDGFADVDDDEELPF
jgi:hypothetical protein